VASLKGRFFSTLGGKSGFWERIDVLVTGV
jgi:hypothetical protein